MTLLKGNHIVVYFGLTICTIGTLLPIMWLIPAAFTKNAALSTENFREVVHVMGYSYANSLVIACVSTIMNVVVCSISDYTFARMDFRGRGFLYNVLFLPYLTPIVLLTIPLYVIFRALGVINTFVPLILLYQLLMGPVNIWILTDYIKSIPKEVEESALIDGCNQLQVFARITLPLLASGIVSAALLSFIASWNEFILATTFLNVRNLYTFTKAIYIFSAVNPRGAIDWGFVSAASILGMSPLIVFLMILRKYLVAGLARGAVKG